jgi:hypothetical protein
MAPTAAAELLEVRYAGCGEMLEVDWGLVKFICLDCATPQSLPSELLPKLPNRKALPLPWGTTDVRGVRLPYGACGALLSVRLHRCTYPVRGAELTVDTARLKQYLLLSAVASDIIPMLPLGATSSGSPMHVLGRCGTNRRQCGKGRSSLIWCVCRATMILIGDAPLVRVWDLIPHCGTNLRRTLFDVRLLFDVPTRICYPFVS